LEFETMKLKTKPLWLVGYLFCGFIDPPIPFPGGFWPASLEPVLLLYEEREAPF
jgi:hypothetical protein